MDVYRSVVITGGGGTLARELAKVLAARRVEPVIARHADCDVSDPAAVARLFEAHRPSLILNCAAHTGVDLCEDEPDRANLINGMAVEILAEFAKKFGTKLTHFSTDFVFDGQYDRPYRPDDRPSPISAYGRSKLLGESAVAHIAPPDWLVVRTSWLFGRHGNCFPEVILNRARAGHPLRVVCDQFGCPTYAVDLSVAVIEMLDRNAQGIWHLTNDGPTTWYEFARSIISEFELSSEVAPISTAQWIAMRPKQAKRPAYSVLDIRPYAELTGKPMRDWHHALKDYRTECENG